MRQRNIHFYPTHAVVDAAIDEFFGSVFTNTKAVSKYPLTDVYTKEGIAYLEIAVAGFSKDEIKIELTEDSLRIIGSKQEDQSPEDREYIKRDIAKRNFDVAYSLMFPVDHIDAEIVDGILKVVVVPANKQKEIKQIEIK
jgi:HSP20 family molecular chaperone IbpA